MSSNFEISIPVSDAWCFIFQRTLFLYFISYIINVTFIFLVFHVYMRIIVTILQHSHIKHTWLCFGTHVRLSYLCDCITFPKSTKYILLVQIKINTCKAHVLDAMATKNLNWIYVIPFPNLEVCWIVSSLQQHNKCYYNSIFVLNEHGIHP